MVSTRRGGRTATRLVSDARLPNVTLLVLLLRVLLSAQRADERL